MANWFKEEIDQFGLQMKQTVQEASKELDGTVTTAIDKASGEIQGIVKQVAEEFNQQRHLTSQDIEKLIDYATTQMDEKLKRSFQRLYVLVFGGIGLLGIIAVVVSSIISH